jgi:peptidoglycan/LPS O-acetylase OafA/YrhL
VSAAAPRRPGRSVAAVAAAFVITAALSLGTDQLLHATHVYPPWGASMPDALFALATGYRVVYTVLGGYVAAALAPRNPMRHAWILGWIGTFFALVGAAATWNRTELGPRWYPLALVVTALPCVLAGGWLRARRERLEPAA